MNNQLTSFLHFIFSGCQRPQSPHEQIFMKFGRQIGFAPRNNGLGFGGDLDLELVPSDDYHFIALSMKVKDRET